MTQDELANLAGIHCATLSRLERGGSNSKRTIARVATALGQSPEFIQSELPYGEHGQLIEVFHSTGESSRWFGMGDSRKVQPANYAEDCQFETERRRLGSVGFVSAFQSYGVVMPEGPSVSRTEVYARYPCGPNPTYRDIICFCLIGEVSLIIGGKTFLLKKDDSVGYDADVEAFIEPTHDGSAAQYPPIVLFICANRRGKVPVRFRGVMPKRIRHQVLSPKSPKPAKANS